MKSYTTTIYILLCMSTAVFAQEDGVAKHLSSFIRNDQFEHTYVSNRMLSAILKSNATELTPDVRDLLKDIKGMRQLSTSASRKKHFDEFATTFESKGYENILSIRKGNDEVKMFLRNENKSDGELIMVILDAQHCGVTSFYGQINLDNMSRLSKAMNIKGAEYIPQARKK
jgi:hypothetical protein